MLTIIGYELYRYAEWDKSTVTTFGYALHMLCDDDMQNKITHH